MYVYKEAHTKARGGTLVFELIYTRNQNTQIPPLHPPGLAQHGWGQRRKQEEPTSISVMMVRH